MEHNDDYNINFEYITRYIRRTIRENTGELCELEAFAAQNCVPIAQPETMRFIEVLLRGMKAGAVLEVGAAIGYSAIAMAKCGAHITTIERDEKMLELLKRNVERYGFSEKIKILSGDALDVLGKVEGQFDFIFLDAAKAQYCEFLPHCLRLLKPGGVMLSDNILYKGMVATDELAVRRKITIIKRLRKYLDELCGNEGLVTSIVPIGDGCALSYKL